jgi:hypothetical protein
VGSPRPISGLLQAWAAEWSSFTELPDRIAAAARSYPFAIAALHDYLLAYRQDLNSHADGVTAVSILKLLDHLQNATGLAPVIENVADVFDLIPAVRLGATADLELVGGSRDVTAGAHGTLAELCLVSGDQASAADREAALFHYAQAGSSPAVRQTLLDRLHLFEALGFRPTLVSAATGVLKAEPQPAP